MPLTGSELLLIAEVVLVGTPAVHWLLTRNGKS